MVPLTSSAGFRKGARDRYPEMPALPLPRDGLRGHDRIPREPAPQVCGPAWVSGGGSGGGRDHPARADQRDRDDRREERPGRDVGDAEHDRLVRPVEPTWTVASTMLTATHVRVATRWTRRSRGIRYQSGGPPDIRLSTIPVNGRPATMLARHTSTTTNGTSVGTRKNPRAWPVAAATTAQTATISNPGTALRSGSRR